MLTTDYRFHRQFGVPIILIQPSRCILRLGFKQEPDTLSPRRESSLEGQRSHVLAVIIGKWIQLDKFALTAYESRVSY